jgi:transposase
VTEQQLARMAKRRLAILRHVGEVTGNVSLTCRYYGISRQCYYTWRRRYDAHGLDGLRDRSHRPQIGPNATRTEVVGKITYLRQHSHFGPARIATYLRRYHEIQVSSSGVWRILKRLELNRLPASQRYERHDRRWKRYEKPLPGHRVQLDVEFIAPLAGSSPRSPRRYYQFTAVDDCTRLRVLRTYPKRNQQTASSSWATSWSGSRSGSRSSRPTTGPSSAPASTGTSWTRAPATSASSRAPRASTARSNGPTASTPRSSTACWRAW